MENWGKLDSALYILPVGFIKNFINAKNPKGLTWLHRAIREGHQPTVCALLGLGADIEARDKEGATPLLVAVEWKRKDILLILQAYGASLDVKDYADRTLLHYAAKYNNICLATILIDIKRIDINVQDSSGRSPLHEAAKNGHEDMVELLLNKGADADLEDHQNETPSQNAWDNNHMGIFHRIGEHDTVESEYRQIYKP